MGFEAPNYTQNPNVIFDYWMSRLSGIEFKVLCALSRKIFGFHKPQLRERISLSQLEEMTGQHRNKILPALEKLISLGLCRKFQGGTPGQQISIYELIVSNNSDPLRSVTGKENLTAERGSERDSKKSDQLRSVTHKRKEKKREREESFDEAITKLRQEYPKEAVEYAIKRYHSYPEPIANDYNLLKSQAQKHVERQVRRAFSGAVSNNSSINKQYFKDTFPSLAKAFHEERGELVVRLKGKRFAIELALDPQSFKKEAIRVCEEVLHALNS